MPPLRSSSLYVALPYSLPIPSRSKGAFRQHPQSATQNLIQAHPMVETTVSAAHLFTRHSRLSPLPRPRSRSSAASSTCSTCRSRSVRVVQHHPQPPCPTPKFETSSCPSYCPVYCPITSSIPYRPHSHPIHRSTQSNQTKPGAGRGVRVGPCRDHRPELDQDFQGP